VKTVSDRVVRHSLAYLSVQRWLVGGRPLKRKFCIKWTTSWRGSRADQRFDDIWRILYFHRNDWNGIWHY